MHKLKHKIHKLQRWLRGNGHQGYISRRKRELFSVLGAVVLIAALAGAYVLLQRLEASLDAEPEGAGLALSREELLASERASLYYNGEKYVYRDNLQTMLVMGIDDLELEETHSYRNSGQADFLALAVFDHAHKTCTILQLNRDTMAEIPVLDTFGREVGTVTEQLALAHTYGNGLEESCENTAEAVKRFLYGVKIDNYLALTMNAIPVLNDLVGGVIVHVEDDFTGVDDTLPQGESVRLDAGNVENFVRARSSMREDKTNLNRMARQRMYLDGLYEAMQIALDNNRDFVLDAYASLADSLVSDCSVYVLNDYARRFSGYRLNGILVPEGEAVEGEKYMEFYVDETGLQELILETFYEPIN